MWSCYDGNEPIAQLLLRAGADTNAASAAGQTPLIRAAGQGHLAIVRALLAAGADKSIAIDHATARDWADRNGHLAVAALLAVPGPRP
jgi:ankyrin repeat protein